MDTKAQSAIQNHDFKVTLNCNQSGPEASHRFAEVEVRREFKPEVDHEFKGNQSIQLRGNHKFKGEVEVNQEQQFLVVHQVVLPDMML